MALLSEHIAHIKTVLSRGAASDNTRFSDRQIYFMLKYLRAKLLKQKFDKYHYVSPFNYQTITCIPLSLVSANEGCECYDDGCQVLKSQYEIPRVIVNRNQMMLEVFTQSGELISLLRESEAKRAKYSKTKNKGYTYEIINNYLYVRGDHRLKVIKIVGIFEDPMEVNIPGACGEGVVQCFDPYSDDFPLDLELTDAINKLAYEELIKLMQVMPEDIENNSKDVQPQQAKQ